MGFSLEAGGTSTRLDDAGAIHVERLDGMAAQVGIIHCFIETAGGRERLHPARPAESKDGERGAFHWRQLGLVGEVNVSVDPQGHTSIHVDLGNEGDEKIELLSVGMELSAGMDGAVCLVNTVDQSPVSIIPATDDFDSHAFTLLQWPDSESALLVGFSSLLRATCHVYGTGDEGGGRLEAVADYHGYLFDVGEQLTSESFWLGCGIDAQRLLGQWADALASQHGALTSGDLPVGWLGWAWTDAFAGESAEQLILETAEAIAELGLKELGFNTIWSSLTNLPQVTPGKGFEVDERQHPQGIQWLAAQLADQGLTLGLWYSAFWKPDTPDERERWLGATLLDADGAPLRQDKRWPYGEHVDAAPEKRLGFLCLDGSNSQVRQELHDLFSCWREWGVGYVMCDFLEAGSGPLAADAALHGHPQSESAAVAGAEVLRQGLKAVREGAGERMVLLGSTGPLLEGVGLLDAMRVAIDYCEGRPRIPATYFHPATYIQDDWPRHKAVLTNVAARAPFHRRLFKSAASHMLTVDEPLPMGEARIAATLTCMAPGVLFFGDDLREMHPERLALLKRCLPVLEDGELRVLDLFSAHRHGRVPSLLLRRYERTWDDWTLLAAFNLEDDACVHKLTAECFGLDPAGDWLLFDFHARRLLGELGQGIKLCVPAGDVRLLRISRRRKHPWLLSTDLHLSQGGASVDSVVWDDQVCVLSVSLRRAAGESGALWLQVPRGWDLVDDADGRLLMVAGLRDHVCRVPLDFHDAVLELSLRFQRLD